MPNHITNILTIQADDKTVQSILESVKSDECGLGSLDFNKVIPMPESLRIESGSRSSHALELYRSFLQYGVDIASMDVQNVEIPLDHKEAVTVLLEKYKKLIKDDPELRQFGKQCHENIQNYGHADWYGWSVENWGTKWNAYDFDAYDGGNSIAFSTAWSAPTPIIEKLSEQYPDVLIKHQWADEDLGFNVGEVEYRNKEAISIHIPYGGGKEAYEMAATIRDYDLAECGYRLSDDGSTYEYDEKQEMEMGGM